MIINLDFLNTFGKQNPNFVKEMLQLFVGVATTDPDVIAQHIENNNLEAAQKLLHRLKPSLDFVGMATTRQKIEQCEALCKANQPEPLKPLFAQVHTEMSQALAEAQLELQKHK